jgi:hypothetical protein
LAERGLPVARRCPLAIASVYLVLVAALSTLAALVDPRRGRELGALSRALILLCSLTFAVWSALFLLAAVPYALVLVALGGTLEFLPVLGPLVAGPAGMFLSVPVLPGLRVVWLCLRDFRTESSSIKPPPAPSA